MGRKIDMKKIEDVTKCQVTFSKRRSSLIKKANEIAVCCDVDVAFVAFSPSGRVSKYCNQKRIEDVLHRYVELPPESRLSHIENVQGKMEKLKHLSHIKSDISKLHFLDKQIENLELQIKKCSLELQILEADLRDYEVAPEQEPASLHQLSWCERNLNHSLEKVIARKNAFANMSASSKQPIQMEMENQTGMLYSSNFNKNELASTMQNDTTGQIMMKLDPWISPYSAKVREGLFQDLVDQANIATSNMNSAGPSNMYNFPLPDYSTILESGITNMTSDAPMPLEQSSVVDPLHKLPDQINVDAWNDFSSVSFPDAVHMTTQTLCNFQAPRFTSTTAVTANACTADMPQSLYNETMQPISQFANSNFNQFNLEGEEIIGQVNMSSFGNNLSNINAINGSIDVEGSCRINSSQMQGSDQIQAPSDHLQAEKDLCRDTLFDNLHQEAFGQNVLWTTNTQRSGSWDWEDLLFSENFQFGDSSKHLF